MILDAKLKSRKYMIVTSEKRTIKNIVRVKTFHEDIFKLALCIRSKSFPFKV